jgi:hypothetical protein
MYPNIKHTHDSVLHNPWTQLPNNPSHSLQLSTNTVQGVLSLECEADHSPPIGGDIKKTWLYTSTPPYILLS